MSQTQSEQTQIKVWDLFVRLSHWIVALSFAIAYIVEDHWLDLHVLAGYTIAGLVVLRIIWGFIGTRYARFSDFVKSRQLIIQYIFEIIRNRPTHYIGHNPAGGAMVVALLVALLLTAISGMTLYGASEYLGPFSQLLFNFPDSWVDPLEELHEFFANATLLLVLLHLAGVAVASLQHRENLPRSMITGIKQLPPIETPKETS